MSFTATTCPPPPPPPHFPDRLLAGLVYLIVYSVAKCHCVPCLSPATIAVVVCHSTKVGLLFNQAEKAPSLRMIIKMDGEITAEERQRSKDTGLAIHSMAEVQVRGGVL